MHAAAGTACAHMACENSTSCKEFWDVLHLASRWLLFLTLGCRIEHIEELAAKFKVIVKLS